MSWEWWLALTVLIAALAVFGSYEIVMRLGWFPDDDMEGY